MDANGTPLGLAPDAGTSWSQPRIDQREIAAAAAHRQLGCVGPFGSAAIDAQPRAGRDGDRGVLVAASDRLLGHDRHRGCEAAYTCEAATFVAEAFAEAFLQLLSALRERGEVDAYNDGSLGPSEAGALWRTFAERLGDEYGTKCGRSARFMNGATALPLRRTL